MKILHCPTNVGNQPWVLSRCERALGLQSDLVVNYGTWLGYPSDRKSGAWGAVSLSSICRRVWEGFSAPFRYDVLHYYFGRSLLYWDDWPTLPGWPFLDLKLAKRLGKPVFMTLQGCDIRLAGESNRRYAPYTPCAPSACPAFDACRTVHDNQRRYLADEILPICDQVFYLNPELGHYLPSGCFLPYSNVDLDQFSVVAAEKDVSRKPRIVHAPSNGAIKGTNLILDALEQLKSIFDFELILVEGVPNEQALELYRSADLAIDQVLAGWYGGVAVEWMAMGIPVLCYLREDDLQFVPDAMLRELPIRNVNPGRLFDDLVSIFEDRSEWPSWGRAGRRFVERWHNPNTIARAMIDMYKVPGARWDLSNYVLAKS